MRFVLGVVIWSGIALAVLMLCACEDNGQALAVSVSGPDKHGVVCYAIGLHAISCVQVQERTMK